MKCGFCGREIPETPGREQSCGSCIGGCRKVHCPYCGYANPAVPARFRRWLDRRDDDQGGDANR